MFYITIEGNNGYSCGCCRSTWEFTEECDTVEEARKIVNEHDNQDYKVISVIKGIEISLSELEEL